MKEHSPLRFKHTSRWHQVKSLACRGTCGSHLGIKVRWQCFSSSETLHEKSFPVRVLMLYACRGEQTKNKKQNNNTNSYHHPSHNTRSQLQHWISMAQGSLFGGTRGLPLDAHHPTGCTSGMQRLHQKSLPLSLSKPSYRRRALNPARHKTWVILSKSPIKVHLLASFIPLTHGLHHRMRIFSDLYRSRQSVCEARDPHTKRHF